MNPNKSVLFFSPDTFGYYKSIVGVLEQMHYNVHWHNIIPSANLFTRIVFRLFPNLVKWYSIAYFNRKINWHIDYDNIIVIKGEGIDVSIIEKLRKKYPTSKMTIYNWDSIKNNPGFIEKRQFFDAAFTFDFLDAETHPDVKYMPLFFNSADHPDEPTKTEKYYAGIFVGTLHSERYRLIESIRKKLDEITGKPSFCYYYYPNKYLYLFLSLFKENFRVAREKVKFTPVSQKEIIKIADNSDVVIDIVHENQSGLTMRTIEAIGAKKKIITNNKFIQQCEFFHPNNIYVISNTEMEGLSEFIEADYHTLEELIYKNLSIQTWTARLL